MGRKWRWVGGRRGWAWRPLEEEEEEAGVGRTLQINPKQGAMRGGGGGGGRRRQKRDDNNRFVLKPSLAANTAGQRKYLYYRTT